MPRHRLSSIRLSLLLLALSASVASAQRTPTAADTLAVTRTDSTRATGGGWLVALLKKIARRSDDSVMVAATTTTESDGTIADDAAATATRRVFSSRKDSLAYESARTAADRANGYRLVVDIFAHQLYVIDREDTLYTAPVATAMNATLSYGGKSWRFETPRGVRKVLSKDKDPIWTPPEWHYAEVALEHQLKLRQLQRGQTVRLSDGTKLTTRGDEVGIISPGEKEFVPLVLDEHVVFDNTLFIPPAGTKHRSIQGELGHFRLALGDGYQLHGTPYSNSIGAAVTHGCIRLRDEDIEWLYDNVPVGARVYLY
ncbi:MAG: L,D-transpeptidase [Gemmatimonadaceae bacterium]|nr:L,D-transpeptidase [Gemmatimonadaceae bacterium]NUO94640.1 L,D-transpeptidase [Gemmatimonadaceae bacterium]NUP57157.1 L,D-transpeptidase [Gemmatimonadaceae bacterium]NUP70702.1 L,D-transpeptidase [Gemmatimonadaceae bacterium]NUR33329.1 L,D-transpeptidase [Gemmatimonadaceae bacterium]